MILVKTAVMMVNKICTITTYTLNLVDWIENHPVAHRSYFLRLVECSDTNIGTRRSSSTVSIKCDVL